MKVTAIAQQRARAVTAQLDSRPSRTPIPSGAVTKRVRHSGPHSPLCGSESAYAGLPHSIPTRHRKVGAKCGSDSGDAASAQGTVRTTFADSRVLPHSLGSAGKVRINARSPPHPTPGLKSPCFPPWTKATRSPQSEFSLKFCVLRVTCAFTVSVFHPEQLRLFFKSPELASGIFTLRTDLH